MWHGWQGDVKFYRALAEADLAIATEVRGAGCPCSGRLHRADYPRKPRGELGEAEELFCRRISFCCDREGCRARTTPPSLRFLGRKVYVSAVVLAASALYVLMRAAGGGDPSPEIQGRRVLGVPARTARRWHVYWVVMFVAAGFWKDARARFMPPVDEAAMPSTLLERFAGDASEKLIGALRFVAPTTTSPPRARIPRFG